MFGLPSEYVSSVCVHGKFMSFLLQSLHVKLITCALYVVCPSTDGPFLLAFMRLSHSLGLYCLLCNNTAVLHVSRLPDVANKMTIYKTQVYIEQHFVYNLKAT